MKILLVGEPSNLHWTLAQGLRAIGHRVDTVSDGNGWKRCRTDYFLLRKSNNLLDSFGYLFKAIVVFLRCVRYDVVQISNPIFLDLKPAWNKLFFRWLQWTNKKVFLGAFGDDYFWISACLDNQKFRYSNFFINGVYCDNRQNSAIRSIWESRVYKELNHYNVSLCNGVIACLYEYFVPYSELVPEKATYIPLPINIEEIVLKTHSFNGSVRFFIGIDKARAKWKGSDVMLSALKRVVDKYPTMCTMTVVESVPYAEYVKLLEESDVLLDQLYSYTPAMNALLAMARGLVVVGGGEEEMYELLGEKVLRPIINVLPNEQDVFDKLEWLVLNRHRIPQLAQESRLFVEKHHNYISVAKQYVDFWNSH